jgi:hypothetical protein
MSDNKRTGAFERRFSSRKTGGRAVSPSAPIDETGLSGILGLLNLLLQFASVVAGGYVALRYRFWSGAALITAVQVWHWLLHRISNGLMWLHARRMSYAEQRLLLLRKDLYGLTAAPLAWVRISKVCGWVFLTGSSAALWWSLEQLS